MCKNNSFLAMFASILISCSPCYAQYYYSDPIVLNDNSVLTKYITDDNERLIIRVKDIPTYEIVTRTNPDTARILLNLKNFNEDTLKMMGIKWFKADIISNPSEEHGKLYIETYYNSDSALQFTPKLCFFRSKNKEFVKSVMGGDIIGLTKEEMIQHFGEGVRTQAGKGYRYMHSIRDITGKNTDERIYFYTEDSVVTEISYERHEPTLLSVAMMSFWGYRPVTEGWLTRGECIGKNVDVFDKVPDGETIGKIGGPGRDNEVMVLEIATTGGKFNWVKIVTKSGLTGWVYGKFIRPGLLGTSFEQTLNNSIEYCEWFAKTLGTPNYVVENNDQNGKPASVTKVYDGYKVEYILPGSGDEESFYSIEFTNIGKGHNNRFCGIGIGDSVDSANDFAHNMLKADAVPFERNQEFYENSMLKWVTVDRKAEVIVATSDGVVSCIIIRKIID